MWNPEELRGRVVVGVDGSDQALQAARWAAGYAAERRLGLTVLTAEEPLAHPVRELVHTGDLDALMEQAAQEVLERCVAAAQAARPGLDVRAARVWDAPTPALIEASGHAELVVMGRRGLGGWGGLLLGSVCAGVVPHAEGPVVVLPHRMDSPNLADGPVVMGVSGDDEGRAAALFALEQAALWRAPVIAVHTWQIALDWQVPVPLDQQVIEAVREYHQTAGATILQEAADRYPDVEVRHEVREGAAMAVLAEKSEQARLVVVGSRLRGSLRGLLLGSTTLGLLQVAHSPVAVIRASRGPGQSG